jgi:hypothetical protein
MSDRVVDMDNLPLDWLVIGYTEYGKWYSVDNSIMSIRQARDLEEQGYITMVQKRVYKMDILNNMVPTSVIELLVRKRR